MIEDTGVRTRTVFLGRDDVGAFLRRTLGPTLLYAARVAPTIAYSIDDVDRAIQWGFGWELEPFEICDAIGVRELLDALGSPVPPPLMEEVLASGRNRFRGPGRAGLDFGVWLVNPDGGNLRNAAAQGLGMAWSPDGKWIYYNETSAGSLKKVPVSGGAPIVVRPEPSRRA